MAKEPVMIDGVFQEVDETHFAHSQHSPPSEEEIRNNKAIDIRSQRDSLLFETDWMANSDVTMSDEWKAYRQALRDITKHKKFPDTFDVESDFPTKPS